MATINTTIPTQLADIISALTIMFQAPNRDELRIWERITHSKHSITDIFMQDHGANAAGLIHRDILDLLEADQLAQLQLSQLQSAQALLQFVRFHAQRPALRDNAYAAHSP